MSDDYNPYAAPQADLEIAPQPREIWREGRLLLYRPGARLPERCYQCNRPATQRQRRTLSYTPAWPLLLLFGGFLLWNLLGTHPLSIVGFALLFLGLILRFGMRSEIRVEYAICRTHQRLQLALWITTLLLLAITVGVSLLTAMQLTSSAMISLGVLTLLLALPLALANHLLYGLQVQRLERDQIGLRGCGRRFLASLDQYAKKVPWEGGSLRTER